MAGSTFVALPRNEAPGAIAVNFFAILSAVALLVFAIRVLYLAVRSVLNRIVGESKEYIFFHTQIGYYVACLLLASMFNSISGLLGLRTLAEGGTFQDGFCSAQAFLMQFGNISMAYFTTVISLHTFNSLVLRNRQAAAVYLILFGWIVAGILSALPFMLPMPNGTIYGVSGLSCGVRQQYPKTQFLLHLLPIFFTAIFSAVLFALTFLVLRGTLVIKGGVKVYLNPGKRWSVRLNGYHKFVGGIAKSMIWYPIAYIAFLVPYSVTRLFALSGFAVPFQAMVFAFTCWFMLGVVNVLLVYNTLRVLSPAFDGRSSKDPESADGQDPLKRGLSTYHPDVNQEKLYPFPMSPATDTSAYDSERILTAYPERTVSIASYYTYSSPPLVASNMTAVSTLNTTKVKNSAPLVAAGSPSSDSIQQHSRDNSVASLISLPAPPRRTRVSPITREQTADLVRSTPQPRKLVVVPPQTGPISPSSPETIGSPFLKRETSVRARTPSDGSKSSIEDLDIAGWLAKQNPNGSLARGVQKEALLSAVIPSGSFSLPRTPSPISAKSSSSPRLLLTVLEEANAPLRSAMLPPSNARYAFI